MDNKEDIKKTETEEKRIKPVWNKQVVIFLVLPIILTILFPLGGLNYLCGRFSPYAITMFNVYLLCLGSICFIIFCFIVGIVKLLRSCEKNNKKKKLIITAEIVIPVVFVVLLIAPLFIPIESDLNLFWFKCFVYGFRDRVKSKADVEAIRDWMRTFDKEDYDEFFDPLHRNRWPESFKALKTGRVGLLADEKGDPKVRFFWGSGFMGHWYVDIGMEDMEIPQSEIDEWFDFWLLVEPGVYVWYSG
jgi:hypothetical protein